MKYFPVSIFHEKFVMLLVNLLKLFVNQHLDMERLVFNYLEKTLFLLRSGCTLNEFELLWNSPIFLSTRQYYQQMVDLLPNLQNRINEKLFFVESSESHDASIPAQQQVS